MSMHDLMNGLQTHAELASSAAGHLRLT